VSADRDADAVVQVHHIDAPIEVVFDFFVRPELLVRWIGIASDLDARPGGRFRFELLPGEFCSGEYVEVLPPRRVVFTWGWESGAIPVPPGSSTVEIDLEPAGDGTRLRLTHHGLTPEHREMHDDGWSRFLPRLAAAAVGVPLPPDPSLGPPPGPMRTTGT
jgi:uncharacterized protein YndB with AHSA1/START domain